jgi:N-acyl-D-aspartate/D-glutamate deacylase
LTQSARAFTLTDQPNYEPSAADSIAAIAAREGREPMDVFYDAVIADEGRAFVMRPLLNFTEGNLDAVREMLMHPTTTWGLGDGGAHAGTTCDASTPTTMLTHWARDRADGIPLETVVQKMTARTAALYGLGDRGRILPGLRADLNVIDHDHLALHAPVMVHDLPAGARRFVQRASGYVATIVRGRVTMREGVETGARPGALIRGAR